MKILIAPNSFKECADSTVVATILADVLRRPGVSVRSLPLSDGGDGFARVCAGALHLSISSYEVGRIDRRGTRQLSAAHAAKSQEVFFELADVIGLKDVPPARRNPLRLNSQRAGELLKALTDRTARSGGFSRIVIGVGGTATNDMGLGLCVPFGLRLLDENETELPVQPELYSEVRHIVLPDKISAAVEVVLDVQIPLTGRKGTAEVFARQKGAHDADIPVLERGFRNILRVLRGQHGIMFSGTKIGAGGGVCVGLSLLSSLKITSAEDFLNQTLHLKEMIGEYDIIVTGEGRFDAQSFMKKATGIVVRESLRRRKTVFILAGSIDVSLKKKLGRDVHWVELSPMFRTREESIRKFRAGLQRAAEEIALRVTQRNT
ncbi:MAG: glycerate kinase [Ignavibacteriales bacterium]|nr:glycerate kinase [Ignavibacteriales bacterium]